MPSTSSIPNPIDRNANSANRQRRNWQRLSQGAATGTIKTSAPITGGSTVGLSFLTTSGLALTGGALALLFPDNSIVGSASGIKVQLASSSALSTTASGLKVLIDGSTITLNGAGRLQASTSGGGGSTAIVAADGTILVGSSTGSTTLKVGTLTSTNLPADVAYTDVANVFTSTQTITGGGAAQGVYGIQPGNPDVFESFISYQSTGTAVSGVVQDVAFGSANMTAFTEVISSPFLFTEIRYAVNDSLVFMFMLAASELVMYLNPCAFFGPAYTFNTYSGSTPDSLVSFQVQGSEKFSIGTDGRVYIAVPNTAPVDANIATSRVSLWVDEGTNNLKFRVLYSDGTTYKTGSVALV